MMIDRRTPSNPVLRVLVLTPLGPNGRGGIDRLMDSIAVEVRTNPINGLQLDFLTTRGKGAITAPLVFATTLLRLALVLWTGRFDVVHINLASYGSAFRKMILAHLCRSFDVPYVIHLHGAHFHKFWASSSPPLRKRIDAMFQGAASVIVLGQFWAEVIRRNIPSMVDRTEILPNATRQLHPGIDRDKARSPQEPHILFLGRLGPRKGTPVLLEALAAIRDTGPWRATLAGDGSIAESRATVARFGLGQRVVIPGWVDDNEVERLLGSADILVLPSEDENLPMSIIEAFAHGLAVVATPVGAVPDIVRHDHTGMLVPVGDISALGATLRQLIERRDIRIRLGEAAKREHKEKLEISVYVRALTRIWKKAARKTRSAQA